ncbi:MAG: LysM peptidoglycan-binding domain-containing protein [Planctomycetaceae bacterium]
MAERLKYFMLGLLFLVVAGVIAYDKWNTVEDPSSGKDQVAIKIDPPPVVPARPPAAEARVIPPVDPILPPDPAPISDRPAEVPPPNPAPPSPPPKPPPTRVHVVAAGETLDEIAVRYYGTIKGVARIVAANGLQDPNRISINQKLTIPDAADTARQPPAAREPRTDGGTTTVPESYRVTEGESDLYAICRRMYGAEGLSARVARVMDINGLWSANVRPGTVLRLPRD